MSTFNTFRGSIPARLRTLLLGSGFAALLFCAAAASAFAQDNEECLDCHGSETPVINGELFASTVHGDMGCVDCHEDADLDHDPGLATVECGNCHDDKLEDYEMSTHGMALAAGKEDVPICQSCHGSHNIFPPDDPRSQIYPLNVVETCGKCHSDMLMAEKHAIDVPDPYQKYVTSIHGQGLIKSGLLVSAVCNDCHGAHKILPHEDPESKIISLIALSQNCLAECATHRRNAQVAAA